MERVEQGCIVLQSVVNNQAPAKSLIPNNMPIEAKARHKTLPSCFMRLCCAALSSDTQVNKHMHTQTQSVTH